MIVAKLQGKGKDILLMLLEPANVEKMRELGQPIVKRLDEFIPGIGPTEIMLAYCPDVQYVAAEMEKGTDFVKALEEGLKRKPVYSRDYEPEKLIRKF